MVAHEILPVGAPDGWWWACEQPERPPEVDLTFFDSGGCDRCRRVARVLAYHDEDGVLIDVNGTAHPLDLSDLDVADADV